MLGYQSNTGGPTAMRSLLWKCLCLFVLAVIVCSRSVFGQGGQITRPTEYQMKAAFLYKFAKFVEWPESIFADSSQQMVIGILGRDPFGTDLEETVVGKSIHGREILVKRFDQLEKMQACQILFISASEKKHLSEIYKKLNQSAILTIGDTEGFGQKGIMINFFQMDNKIHFEINVDAAKSAGLRLSSKLLNLARIIENSS